MKLLKTLALVLCWASLSITLSSKAQTATGNIDYTTGNLINTGSTPTDTTSTWNNGVYVNTLCFQAGQAGNCGPNPSVRPGGVINFSYGTTDLNQIVNINRALAAGGTGVQLSGFNFGFTAKNGNGWDDGRQDYLAAYVKLYGSAGNQLANYDYSSQTNQRYNWTNFNFSETFATPHLASQLSNAQVGFVGRDNNFWAGNYGPEVYNVSFSLKYRVDPCALNAAYSPNCSGFSNIIESGNLLNSNAWGQSMAQAAAINVALQNGGIGAQVHGMRYSFDWAVGSDQCTSSFLFWCTGWTDSNINVNVRMTSAGGQALLNKNYGFSGQWVGGHVEDKMLLPTTMNQTSLGYVGMSSSGWGDAQAGNFKTSLIYTPDPCVSNPLYSPLCSGYAVAFAKNMILGSTVASASGPIVSSGGTSVSSSTGTVDQSSPTQQTQQTQPQQQQQSSPPPQDATQPTAVAQADPAQPAPSGAPSPAGGPAQTQASSSTSQQQSGSSGGGAGPSKLAMSVVKSAQDKDKVTQNAAVQSAAKTLEAVTQSSQASSNMAISMNQDMSANSAVAAATFASRSTQTSIQASTQFNQQQSAQVTSQTQQAGRGMQQVQQQQEVQTTQIQVNTGTAQIQQFVYTPPPQQQDTQSTQVSMLKPPAQSAVEIQQPSSGTGLTLTRNPFAYNPLGSINTTNIAMMQPQPAPTFQFRNETKAEVEAPPMSVASFGGVGKAGNPLSELMMQQRFESMQSNISPSMSSVNKNAQSNELAGGVDIASMATVPVGFSAYSIVLKDAAFYEPKEVYKNQRTVDNERVLRGLTRGSDSLHQQMVDQQYKIGN